MEKIPQWTKQDVSRTLPSRDDEGHKGTYGTALLMAGSPGMPGAAALAAKGSMRSGLGKLVVATAAESIPVIAAFVPEATFEPEGMERITRTSTDLDEFRAIAIGPGIIPGEATEQAVEKLIKAGKPLVLDAGALAARSYSEASAPVILTPHAGEFSRITGVPVDELQNNRAACAADWAVKLDVTIVLKGKHTVIAFPDGQAFINATGNSALAKGGTGDTLTGMMLGMLCFHDNWQHAVLNAVHLHGACADEWISSRSAHTLVANELTELLPEVMKTYER